MSTLPKPFDYTPAMPATDVSFRLHDADPPSPLYIQRDDRLVLQASTIETPTDTFTLTARLLAAAPPGAPIDVRSPQEVKEYLARAGSNIITIQQQITVARLSTDSTVVIDLAEGYLLSLAVTCATSQFRGSGFVRAWIQRASTVASVPSAALLLMADYVTTMKAATWPGGRVMDPSESSGRAITEALANPVAGADFIYTGSQFQRRRIIAVHATLTTAVAVANRVARLELRDSTGNVVFQSGNNATQAASLAFNYNFGAGVSPGQVDATSFMASLPDNLHLLSTFTIRSVTAALQAADQWSAVVVTSETWMDGV